MFRSYLVVDNLVRFISTGILIHQNAGSLTYSWQPTTIVYNSVGCNIRYYRLVSFIINIVSLAIALCIF